MNGVVEITIKDQIYTLRFNVHGAMAFESKMKKSVMDYTTTEGQIKLAADLLYSGMLGQAIRDEKPIPNWGESMDLFDVFSNQDDFGDQFKKMFDTYTATEWAKKLLEVENPEEKTAGKKKAKVK